MHLAKICNGECHNIDICTKIMVMHFFTGHASMLVLSYMRNYLQFIIVLLFC